MKIPTYIKTAEDARQLAIDWQNYANEQNLSYSILAMWTDVFERLGRQFNLTDEFRENGII